MLIDALLPFLAQRFPDLRRHRMDIRQDGQLLGDFLKVEARALRERDVDDPVSFRANEWRTVIDAAVNIQGSKSACLDLCGGARTATFPGTT